jgi:hypothetical protein
MDDQNVFIHNSPVFLSLLGRVSVLFDDSLPYLRLVFTTYVLFIVSVS